MGQQDHNASLTDQGQLGPIPQPAPGHRMGNYQLLKRIGCGGLGSVFRARHTDPSLGERNLAVKVLRRDLAANPKVVGLFHREAYLLPLLQHQNVVRVYEAGIDGDYMFIAMEYVEGRDLHGLLVECLAKGDRLPLSLSVFVVREVLKALCCAHGMSDADGSALRVLHHDVNPSNIFLSFSGNVKLGDFGLATMAAAEVVRERELTGTAGYFAPEQLAGKPADERSDLFSLGVVLFELLAGRRLFEGTTQDRTLRLNERARIPRLRDIEPSVPVGLAAVVERALSREPDHRFASAPEMLGELQGYLASDVGMWLGVAGWLRTFFSEAFGRELERRALHGETPINQDAALIGLCTADVTQQQTLGDSLLAAGYWVEVSESHDALREALRHGEPPQVMLFDVDSPGFEPEAILEAMAAARAPVPIVGLCREMEPNQIARAFTLGATDLLMRPTPQDRLLTAIRAASMGLAVRTVGQSGADPHSQPPTRVLMVSADARLHRSLTRAMAEWGYELFLAKGGAAAMMQHEHRSFRAVISDMQVEVGAVEQFVRELRTIPGNGLVPVLCLGSEELAGANLELPRTTVRPRSDDPVVLATGLRLLLADNHLGRVHARYKTNIDVDGYQGGKRFNGKAINVSRGGLRLRCETPLEKGILVSLTVDLSNGPVDVRGTVLRIDTPADAKGEEKDAGIRFDAFTEAHEGLLIAFIESVAGNRTLGPV